MKKLSVSILIVLLMTGTYIYAEEKDESYGLIIESKKASKKTEVPKEKSRIGCRSEADSYRRYVKTIKGYSKGDENKLKKHLECWPDRNVMLMLAQMYVKRKNFYLAKKVYLEAGAEKEALLVDKILKANEKKGDRERFIQKSLKISGQLKRKAHELKQLGITFSIIGPMLAGTGFGLFLYDKAFGVYNSPTAQYALMFSGLSMLGGGITMNYFADYKREMSYAYQDIATDHYEIGATPTQYYEFSGLETKTRKKMIKKLRAHGASLIILSVPLIIISAFSMVDAYKWVAGGHSIFDIDDWVGGLFYNLFRIPAVIIAEVLTLVPGITCLIGGISMIVRSYEWENKNKPKSVLTLSSITPMIDPVTRSYGISVGFSF